MTRLRQVRATTFADKLAYWISHRINVLFRCGPGICIGPKVSAAFGNAGLQWRAPHVFNGEFEQIRSDDTIKAVWIDGLDRVSKKLRRAVLNMAGERPSQRPIWATVTVSEDDFYMETADPLHAEAFDIVVDVPFPP